jgi:hypothetical protein
MKICDKQSAFLWSQNRVQTAQFVRGFQQLIPKEWTDMFNEHEFQVFYCTLPLLIESILLLHLFNKILVCVCLINVI